MDFTPPSDLGKYERAEWFQERIEIQMDEFSRELKANEQLQVSVILSDGRIVYPTWFGYHNPNMLVIDGEDQNGRSVRLLIPHSNVQVLLTAVPGEGHEKRPPIGFQAREE
jgi:hypothetical protein